jgi:hypothetical protein
MKRTLFLIFGMFCALMAGCSWMGQTAGKAQAKIERKAQDLEQGYHKGYEGEKAKSPPEQEPQEPADSADSTQP